MLSILDPDETLNRDERLQFLVLVCLKTGRILWGTAPKVKGLGVWVAVDIREQNTGYRALNPKPILFSWSRVGAVPKGYFFQGPRATRVQL